MALMIHENAINHGFIEAGTKRPVHEHIALIHSEVSELLEEYREYGDTEEHFKFPEAGSNAMPKPVGVPSEAADIVIRVLDYCAEYSYDLELVPSSTIAGLAPTNATPYRHAITEHVVLLHKLVTSLYPVNNKPLHNYENRLLSVVIAVSDMCAEYDINLYAQVMLKMKYNESRPYKHGKHL